MKNRCPDSAATRKAAIDHGSPKSAVYPGSLDTEPKVTYRFAEKTGAIGKGILAMTLNLGLLSGLLTIPGCGATDDTPTSSSTRGAPSFALKGPTKILKKTPDELLAFTKNLEKELLASAPQKTAGAPQDIFKKALVSQILSTPDISRLDLEEVLGKFLASSSSACGGVPCSKVFGIEENEVPGFLDRLHSEIASRKDVSDPAWAQKQGRLLSALDGAAKDFDDIPCSPVP